MVIIILYDYIMLYIHINNRDVIINDRDVIMWHNIYIYIYIIWLMVDLQYPSEKYESQMGLLFPIYGKYKMFQTTNQLYYVSYIFIYIFYYMTVLF